MKKQKPNTEKRTSQRKLSKEVIDEINVFIEYHPAKRLSVNLRRMLFEYMMCEGATENVYISDLLYDLAAFIELLDLIQAENESNQNIG